MSKKYNYSVNHSNNNSINVGRSDGSTIVNGSVNGNITTSSNSTKQSGNFGIGNMSGGEIKDDSEVTGTRVNAVDYAQRFTLGWQFFTVIIGLIIAIITVVGIQIDFDDLLNKQKEQTILLDEE